MSFYVWREKESKSGWVGPIRSERQAWKEVEAWKSCGWDSTAFTSTPEVRAEVRAWEKAKRVATR